jgi:hypothetical protein
MGGGSVSLWHFMLKLRFGLCLLATMVAAGSGGGLTQRAVGALWARPMWGRRRNELAGQGGGERTSALNVLSKRVQAWGTSGYSLVGAVGAIGQ